MRHVSRIKGGAREKGAEREEGTGAEKNRMLSRFLICILHQIVLCDHSSFDGSCGTHRMEDSRGFWWGNLREKTTGQVYGRCDCNIRSGSWRGRTG